MLVENRLRFQGKWICLLKPLRIPHWDWALTSLRLNSLRGRNSKVVFILPDTPIVGWYSLPLYNISGWSRIVSLLNRTVLQTWFPTPTVEFLIPFAYCSWLIGRSVLQRPLIEWISRFWSWGEMLATSRWMNLSRWTDLHRNLELILYRVKPFSAMHSDIGCCLGCSLMRLPYWRCSNHWVWFL